MTRPRPLHIAAAVLVAAASALCIIAVPGSTAGYIGSIANSTNTAGTAASFTCAAAYAVDKASATFIYALNEASNSTAAVDSASGLQPGSYRGAMTTSTTTPIGCTRDTGGAYVLNGTTSYLTMPAVATTPLPNPTNFSIEVWFKSTVASGKLMGWGSAQTGLSGQYDRQVYFSTTGQLIFGTYNGGTQTITSPLAYNDGLWHHLVATQSTTLGMALYLDGAKVASNASFTTAENHTGFWRIGYDNQAGWPNAGANNFFTGSMSYAAAYSVALTQAQVTAHYVSGK